jgi:hypothetical protein
MQRRGILLVGKQQVPSVKYVTTHVTKRVWVAQAMCQGLYPGGELLRLVLARAVARGDKAREHCWVTADIWLARCLIC